MISIDGDFGVPLRGLQFPGQEQDPTHTLYVKRPEDADKDVFPYALGGQVGYSVVESDVPGEFMIINVPEKAIESVRRQIEQCGLIVTN